MMTLRRARALRTVLLACLIVTSAACRRDHDANAPAPAAPRFTLVDDVARDARTGLEWTARDHERSLSWDDAYRHCGELTLARHDDWRVPELAELEGIYDPRFDEACGERRCRLDPAIRLGGPYVWSITTRGPGTRFYVDFSYGTSFSPSLGPGLVRRTLCVRGSVAPAAPP